MQNDHRPARSVSLAATNVTAVNLWLALLLSSGVQAQDLIINDEPCQLDGDFTLEIVPASGDVKITTQSPLECGGVAGAELAIDSFSINPATIGEGSGIAEITVSYTTTGATSCTGILGDPGLINASSGWHNESVPAQSQNETFIVDTGAVQAESSPFDVSLRCSAGANTVTETTQLFVGAGAPPPVPGSCDNVAPPSLTRDTAILVGTATETTQFSAVWGAFGGSGTTSYRIRNDQYAALEFTTNGQVPSSIGTVSLQPGTESREGPMLYTISECPGDFGPAVPAACRKLLEPQFQGSLVWAIEPTQPLLQCDLEMNKTYYFNIVPTKSLPTTQDVEWTCFVDGSEDPNVSFCAGKGTARERD